MRFLSVCAASLVAVLAASARAELPKPQVFGRLPAIADVAISPSGAKLAILGNRPSQPILSIDTLDSKESVSVGFGDNKVRYVTWADDTRLLVGVTVISKPPRSDHKYAFERDLIVTDQAKVKDFVLNNSDDDAAWYLDRPVLKVVRGDKPVAMVQVGGALYRANLDTGFGAITDAPASSGFALDLSGGVRARYVGAGYHTDEILGMGKGGLLWRTVAKAAIDKTNDLDLYGYSDRENAVYWAAQDAKGARFYRTLLGDGSKTELGANLPAGHSWMMWDGVHDEPLGFVTENERRTYSWTSPGFAEAYAKLSRVFKGREITFRDWSDDRGRIVLRVEAADAAPAWYLYDAKRGEVSPLGESYPELGDRPLGATRWITYKARDGLEIPAYLTVPPGAEGRKLPLIVMPHGGPALRDHYGFDWWVQFLVSRGYAVLQPQFRGSAGFGPAFRNAGQNHWGDLMQTDLLDGVNALAAQGAVDPRRVCIVGASYGGFAALAGVTFFPEAYRCAVSVAGVSDPPNLVGDINIRFRQGGRSEVAYWRDQIGLDDYKKALSISPVHNAEKVLAPVLLIHGEEDTTVPFSQSQSMAAALKTAGKDVTLVPLKGDDHYLSSSASRTRMLEAIDAFLQRVMPATP